MASDILLTVRNDEDFIREVLRRCWCREPEPEVMEVARAYFIKNRKSAQEISLDQLEQVTPIPLPADLSIREAAVYSEFCLIAFNSLEFIIIQ